MARGTFICATAVALQGVASSGRTCEILFIAGRRRRRKKRERGEGVCVCEREREEKGREMTKIEGRREGEKEVVERRRKKDRYLSTVTEERHVLSRCRADADAHTAIHPARYPRIGFQEDGLYEGAIRDILYYGGRGRERGQ